MGHQSDAKSGGEDSSRDESFKFAEVLAHELEIVAARRNKLNTKRGDLEGTKLAPGPAPLLARSPQLKAWQGRLLGLSFSGGGIRSATFNLGVLQALAGRGVLRYVDYLSTVSGGGYIGSWLTALSQRRFARITKDAEAADADVDSLLDFDADGFKSFEKALAWSAGDRLDKGKKKVGDAEPAKSDTSARFDERI